MNLITLLLLFYVTPAVVSYLGIRRQYRNEWVRSEPSVTDLLMVFVPLLNWGFAMFSVIEFTIRLLDKISDALRNSTINKRIKRSNLIKRFFNVK